MNEGDPLIEIDLADHEAAIAAARSRIAAARARVETSRADAETGTGDPGDPCKVVRIKRTR